MNDAEKREKRRVQMVVYNQLPHRKEYQRQAAKNRSAKHKLETTAKRFTEHSVDDLLFIASQKYKKAGLDFDAHIAAVRAVLEVLHESPCVLSEVRTNDIRNDLTPATQVSEDEHDARDSS